MFWEVVMKDRLMICDTILAIKFEWNLNLDQNKIQFINLNAGVRISFWFWNNRTLYIGSEDLTMKYVLF